MPVRLGPGGMDSDGRVERFTEPAVLLLLREGPMHGYQLLDRLPGLSPHDGRIDLGNLYRLLRALEADDLVCSEWGREPRPPRRVYRLTASGAGLLAGWARSLRDMRSGIDQFLILYDARR